MKIPFKVRYFWRNFECRFLQNYLWTVWTWGYPGNFGDAASNESGFQRWKPPVFSSSKTPVFRIWVSQVRGHYGSFESRTRKTCFSLCGISPSLWRHSLIWIVSSSRKKYSLTGRRLSDSTVSAGFLLSDGGDVATSSPGSMSSIMASKHSTWSATKGTQK